MRGSETQSRGAGQGKGRAQPASDTTAGELRDFRAAAALFVHSLGGAEEQ